MKSDRKYQFSWDLLGDLDLGRPNPGTQAHLEVYRLMQYSRRDVLEEKRGTACTDEIFFKAGKFTGKEFFKTLLYVTKYFSELTSKLQVILKEMGIGILHFEEADTLEERFTLTLSEDPDCSGLPESFSGHAYTVSETDCWCTDDRVCRFVAEKDTHNTVLDPEKKVS